MSLPSGVSSAYRRHDELVTQSGISFIKSKRRGPKTDPCGTPEVNKYIALQLKKFIIIIIIYYAELVQKWLVQKK